MRIRSIFSAKICTRHPPRAISGCRACVLPSLLERHSCACSKQQAGYPQLVPDHHPVDFMRPPSNIFRAVKLHDFFLQIYGLKLVTLWPLPPQCGVVFFGTEASSTWWALRPLHQGIKYTGENRHANKNGSSQDGHITFPDSNRIFWMFYAEGGIRRPFL